jgi:retinol dehydrogenase 12
LSSFLKSQFTKLPYPDHDCTGKTIIITGANVGLGLEAARHFVRLNAAKVILACRSSSKGEAAKLNIEATTKRKDIVEVWTVDLNSYQSVKDFCRQAEGLERIDIVIENAGIAIPTYVEIEGMESTIQTNVISTFLMALLLLPILRTSAEKHGIVPRLVIVASDAHFQVWSRPGYYHDVSRKD